MGRVTHSIVRLILALALPWAQAEARPADIGGKVTAVHDGDTFSIGKQRIRVFGIDAPELRQQCRLGPSCVPCGEQSRDVLSGLILGKPLTCVVRGQSYDRQVAECAVDGVAIGPRMLEHGQATAYRSFLRKVDREAYLGAEDRARASKAGVWGVVLIPPADWRKHRARLECER